jgi:hypothetical protein
VLSAFACYSANAQRCHDGLRKSKPYVSIWGYPKPQVLNLLDREYSQDIHFGFGMGLNVFDYAQIDKSGQTVYVPRQGNVILYADLTHAKPGFNINAVMDYRLNKNLNVRFLPGIFFGQRQLDFYREDTKSFIRSVPVSSNYFEFPLILKYSAKRFTNIRPYVITGMNMRVNFSNKIGLDSERYIGMKKWEPFAEAGFGFDFYFNYFRLGVEFKVSKGLINCLSNDTAPDYEYLRNSLNSMKSNMAVFTVSFEL